MVILFIFTTLTIIDLVGCDHRSIFKPNQVLNLDFVEKFNTRAKTHA